MTNLAPRYSVGSPWVPVALALLTACGGPAAEPKTAELRSGRPTKASLQVQDPIENAPERFLSIDSAPGEPPRWPTPKAEPGTATLAAPVTETPLASESQTRGVISATPEATLAGRSGSASLVRGKGDEADRELALGDAALQRETPELALLHYRKARRLIPKEPAPVVGIVLARLAEAKIPTEYAGAKGEPQVRELLQLLDQAIRLDPNFGQAFLQRGRLYLIGGDAPKAGAALRRAVELLPANPESHSALAVAALAQGEVSAAVIGFQRAAELDPNNAARQANLGTALMMHGDAQGAISAYSKAVALDPNDPRALGDLGTALLATNNIRAAIPHLVQAQKLAPGRATFMNNLGYAQQQQGDLAGALDWFEKALEIDPTLGSAWINLGIARAAQGDRAGAEQALKKALALDPTDPRAKVNLDELRALPKRR
ncbi:MAG: hypothetical protein RJA70_2611 [Pseudomonadota bacterium]